MERKNHTATIAYTALFSALCFLANSLSALYPTISISLVVAITFVSAFFLHPMLAFTVGGVGDFLAAIIFPRGAFNPIITLSSALWGLIMGLCYRHLKFNKTVNIIIGAAIGYLVCSFFLTSAGIWLYVSSLQAKYSMFTFVLSRATVQLPNAIINTAIAILLEIAFRKRNILK
ncbi:MAG: folate family ECF transporter S component [Clostridia bacterium]|nr:folate family ECF transporter S component [Clostridia bacterium]